MKTRIRRLVNGQWVCEVKPKWFVPIWFGINQNDFDQELPGTHSYRNCYLPYAEDAGNLRIKYLALHGKSKVV